MDATSPAAAPPPTGAPARSNFAARHPLVTYFTLAYALSWAVEIPLAAQAQGWIRGPVPLSLHYLAGYGPLLAAVITSALAQGGLGVSDLLVRLARWRVRPIWWLAALSPLVLWGVAALALGMARGTWADPGALGRINYLPDLGAGAFVLWLVTYGVGEETGWRGFALPRLQRGRSALSATLLLSLLWIGWHVPTFLYLETYVRLGAAVLPLFALGIVAGAMVYTWLYNSTGGSILLVAMSHAALNYVTGSPAGDQTIVAIISTAIMVWAVVVVLVWKPASLSPHGKHVR